MNLSKKENELGTRKLEGVTNEDLERAMPGDMLGIGEAEHNIDGTVRGPVSAGNVHSTGEGGDAVWREALLPDEKNVLKRYFK